jgi:hypothetical protein
LSLKVTEKQDKVVRFGKVVVRYWVSSVKSGAGKFNIVLFKCTHGHPTKHWVLKTKCPRHGKRKQSSTIYEHTPTRSSLLNTRVTIINPAQRNGRAG